jgi:hypothetical protein
MHMSYNYFKEIEKKNMTPHISFYNESFSTTYDIHLDCRIDLPKSNVSNKERGRGDGCPSMS